MEPVQITPKANQDRTKPAQGADREENKFEQLQSPLKNVSPTRSASSDTRPQVVREIKLIDGHEAVVGQISVNGQQLDTVLTEGSFNKTRSDQIAYAEKLGYRLATHDENQAYVEGLLAKEEGGTINEAEKSALKTFRERWVRDTQGGLAVEGWRVRTVRGGGWRDDGFTDLGALFVGPSAESK